MRLNKTLDTVVAAMGEGLRNLGAAFKRSNTMTGGETEMSLNRVIIAMVLLPYALSDARYLIDGHALITKILAAFAFGTAVLFFFVVRAKKPNFMRRLFAMLMDLGMLTFAMYAGGQFVAITFPIYLWVIFGNGFRFGIKYLVISCVISVIGFSLVLTTPYWREQAQLGWGLLACLIIVPIYSAKLIRDLSEAKRAAEAASQAKTQFLTAVSHELRTPLNAIIGMGDMLKDTKLDGEQRDMTTTIKSSARSLLSLINGILDFSRIEAGALDIKTNLFSVDTLFSDTAQIVGSQARSKRLRFCQFISPEVEPELIGDSRHLQEVLINLTGNAVKFTHSGYIAVRAFQRTAQDGSAKLVLEVADTGIGISKEAQDRIFERFTQADETIVDRFGGTGLGLTIVKQVIEGMGGSVSVHSEVGSGSTFRLEVPVQRAVYTRSERLNFAEAVTFVVSEDPQTLDVMGKRLESLGLKVRTVDTPSNAVAMLGELTTLGVREAILIVDERCIYGPIEVLGHAIQSPDRLIDTHMVLLKTTDSELEAPESVYSRCRTILHYDKLDDELFRVMQIAGARLPSQAAPTKLEDRVHQQHKALSLLIAEDNKTNQRVIEKILERGGHKCHIVSDGEQALDALEEGLYDLAIMDLNMPVVNGIEAIKLHRLTEHGEDHIPIIALTADATPAAARNAIEAGANACATKPIEPDVLLKMIDRTVTEFGRRTVAPSGPERQDAQSVNVAPLGKKMALKGATIDYACLDNLANLGGEEFVVGLISDYLEDARVLYSEICKAVEAGDVTEIRDKAHAMNSASANIGALEVSRLCQSWETARAQDLLENGAGNLSKLTKALDQARDGLSAYVVSVAQPEDLEAIRLGS
ncbi:hybrid sensor histidine kinase/response regulator [Pseudovibrio sp. SPO723]|uniref:hybrid sensor histidine kinase/response regulator n=1 Tax=Nesiotobacter zosterae TaxID=392721 RepID=UPI0029C1262F|nr:ATP-binding protein [Pseudovibrio sp. SPO723]MDX5592439.1 ATP-binding protein [Pseudovibrio sp. SPO723]